MVRDKKKAKKAKFDLKKFESTPTEFEEPLQCLEESNSELEFMDLYEEREKANTSGTFGSLTGIIDDEVMSDISVQFEQPKQCSPKSQVAADPDEDMVQCVPELALAALLHPESTKIAKPKEKKRPKFKATPRRKETVKKEKNHSKTLRGTKSSKHSGTQSGDKKQDEDETGEDDECQHKAKNKEGSWVQCSKPDCLKWRKIPNDIEPTTMPDRWVCAMNTDESHKECAASQETCDSELDYDVVYTPFVQGSLVWARVPGYPWWPGMVEDDPDYSCCYETDDSNVIPISYHVSFVFDKEVSRSWVSYLSICTFTGTENPNETYSKFNKKYSKPLSKALTQARRAMELPMKERLAKFSFRALYKGPIGSNAAKHKDEIDSHSSSESQHSTPSQASTLFSPPKKSSRDSKLNTSKKTKTSKNPKNEKSPQVSKNSDSPTVGRSIADAESDDRENVVRRRKKKTRVLLSSEDEDAGGQEKQIIGDPVSKVTASSMTRTGVCDAELNAEKVIEQEEAESDLPQTETSCIDNRTAAEVDCTVAGKMTRKDDTERDNIAKKNCMKRNTLDAQPKKLKKTIQKDEMKTKADDSVEKERGVSKKKIKRKATKEDDKDGLLAKKGIDDPEVESSFDLKSCSVKKKKSKREETSKESEVNEEIKKKNKNKNVGKDDPLPPHKERTLSPAGEANEKMANSALSGTSDKKIKKMKKANYTTPHNKIDENHGKQGHSPTQREEEIMDAENCQEVVNVADSASSCQKHNKTNFEPVHKRTKPVFGKFKAPVKSGESVTPAAASTSTKGKLFHKKPSKEMKSKDKHGVEKISSSETLRSPPKNLDCYVSIETLEKEISKVYQELSEAETTTRLLKSPSAQSQTSEGNDCVTMKFLEDELTLNSIARNDGASNRRLTDSPEY